MFFLLCVQLGPIKITLRNSCLQKNVCRRSPVKYQTRRSPDASVLHVNMYMYCICITCSSFYLYILILTSFLIQNGAEDPVEEKVGRIQTRLEDPHNMGRFQLNIY